MALKAMLEKVATGESLKFEYIGTNADNGTLLVGGDVKVTNRQPAKMQAGITSDSHIAKGTCTYAEGTYTFVCDGIKPKRDFVRAAIKRTWSGFTDKIKVTGPDGKEDSEEGTTPPTTSSSVPSQTVPQTGPRRDPPPRPKVEEKPPPPRTGPIGSPPGTVPTRTGPTPPPIDPALTEARNKLKALLVKIDNDILPRLSGPKATQVGNLRSAVERISEGTEPAKLEKGFVDALAKIKEYLAPPPTTDKPPTTGTPPTTGPTRQPPPRPGVTPPREERPTTNPREEDRLLSDEILQLLNVPLPDKARISYFVNTVNGYSRTFNEINAVTDDGQRLTRRQALRDQVIKTKEDARKYVAARTPLDVAMEQCKTFFTTPRPGFLVKPYNKLINDFNAHTNLTDPTACLAKVEELRKGFVDLNNDKEALLRDHENARNLLDEVGPTLPQKYKQFLSRFNSAAAPTEVRTLLAELQQLKDEGPRKAQEAMTTVNSKSLEQLKLLPVRQRIEMLTNLRRGAPSTQKARREALAKLYKAMELEDDFKEKDSAMRQRVIANLKSNPLLNEAKLTWNTKTKTEKVAVLKEALKIQCREMGIPETSMPEITLFSQVPEKAGEGKSLTLEGYFSPSDGKIYINDNQSSFKEDFDDSLDTIIHENTHNYQHKLVGKLESGEITEGHPDYNQALLFQLNFAKGGYLNAEDEGHEAYEKQPVEKHAWLAGGEAHRLFVEDAKAKGAILLQQIKTLATKAPPTFATEIRRLQQEVEEALTGNKSGAIEKAVTSGREKALALINRIKQQSTVR